MRNTLLNGCNWASWIIEARELVVVHECWIGYFVVASVFHHLVESFFIVVVRLTSGIEALNEIHFSASIVGIFESSFD